MKKLAGIILFVIMVTGCETVEETPQKQSISFGNKTLPGYFIKSIAFDNQGIAWLGTFKQGLIKYENDVAIVYDTHDGMLTDSVVIYDMAFDSKGTLWIGGNGLLKFENEQFTHYHTGNSAIPEDFVQAVDVDADDNVWFTSSRFKQGGVVKYDGENFNIYTPENSALPVNSIMDLVIAPNNDVWVALSEYVGNSYLAKFSNDEWTVYSSVDFGFEPYYFSKIGITSDNKVVGALDYMLSSLIDYSRPDYFVFDGSNCYTINTDSLYGVRNTYVDRNDNIWCSNGVHLSSMDLNGNKRQQIYFEADAVFAIAESPNDKMWVGTGNGVYVEN